MIVAIIPARSGSKRIPQKNIINFFGKPLISYSIIAAKKTKIFDKIIVSTDSDKIGSIAKKYGAEYLFKRPKKLSGDQIPTSSVVKHAINYLKKENQEPNFICCIYPTAPLILPQDLINSYKIIKNNKYKCVFSAVKNSYPIQRAFYLNKKKQINMLNKKNFNKRSQDFPETFHDAGQFYWGTYNSWMNNQINFSKTSKIYLLPQLRAQDIDNFDDLEIVKQFYKISQATKSR
jgi:pseudaminic acid cytidylyltransferase